MPLTLKKFNKQPRTFTIQWTENYTPSLFNPVWSWNASWLTAWDTKFDRFFDYSYVLLDENGNEVAEVTQEESWWYWNLDISKLAEKWTIDWSNSSKLNVMIKFPRRWIKMSKSWTTITLSITDEPNASWYQYYAYNSNWVAKDYLYIWAFKWYRDSNNDMRSISWASPFLWELDNFCYYSMFQRPRYHNVTFYTRQLISAYYMMKYWNPDSQTVIWRWLISVNNRENTWWTNSITTATWATNTTASWRIKLFWLEDRRGNWLEWLDWIKYSWTSYQLKASASQEFRTAWQIATFDTTIYCAYVWYITSIVWNNNWMFVASSVNNSLTNWYYSDYFQWDAYWPNFRTWWYWWDSDKNRNWIFLLSPMRDYTNSSGTGRIICL